MILSLQGLTAANFRQRSGVPASSRSPRQGSAGSSLALQEEGRAALGPAPQVSLPDFASVINLWKAFKLGVNTALQISSNPCLYRREQRLGGGAFLTVLTFGFISGKKHENEAFKV